jgi:transcription antitermination protein NusB
MKTSKDPRHQRRVTLLKSLYSIQFKNSNQPKLTRSTKKQFDLIVTKIGPINSTINKYAQKFSTEKMAKIDLAILQLGVFELLFDKSIPYRVVADESIELAKEYGAQASPKFISGILGSIINNHIKLDEKN